MTKDESLKILGDAKIDVSLTDNGEIRASLLELAAKGVLAKADAEANEKASEILNNRIKELEEMKTPVEKRNIVTHKKSKKKYIFHGVSTVYKNQVVTAETLNEKQDLLEELLEKKTPDLEEITKEG